MFQARQILLILVRIYQKTVSLDHGILSKFFPTRVCRFHPSCSQYSYEAVDRFGAGKGLYLSMKRLLRCHPWNEGGYDPVPEK